jgi:hypothetical protein
VKGKTRVGAAEAGNKVVFECTNCALGGIAAMDSRGGKLKVNVRCMKKVFEDLGRFVVKFLETGFESMRGEDRMSGLVGGKN